MEKEKNKYKSAFIVKDAKTYVNAEEAWFQFRGKKEGSILFIIVPRNAPKITHDIFDEVIDSEKWEKIVWFRSYSNYAPRWFKRKRRDSWFYDKIMNTREYIFNYSDRLRLDRLGKKYGPINTIFSGHRNTQEHLAVALKPKELFIMDSGRIQKRLQATGYINDRKKSKRQPVQYLLHKIIGFKIFNRNRTKIFTVYNASIETKHQVVKNNYSYRKMLVEKKETGDLVFFINSPIYIRQNVDIQENIVFIKDIFKQLNLDPTKVVFIPHPVHEQEEDVEIIVNSLGCRVDSRDLPIETKITMYDYLPKMCISPYSTALENLASFSRGKFSIVCAWHYEFDFFKGLHEKRETILEKNPIIDVVEIVDTISLFGFKGKKFVKPLFKNFEEWDASVNSNLISKNDTDFIS